MGVEGQEDELPSSKEESPPEEEGDEGGGEGGIPNPPVAGFEFGSGEFTARSMLPSCSLILEND